jgi:hypothetical protein
VAVAEEATAAAVAAGMFKMSCWTVCILSADLTFVLFLFFSKPAMAAVVATAAAAVVMTVVAVVATAAAVVAATAEAVVATAAAAVVMIVVAAGKSII